MRNAQSNCQLKSYARIWANSTRRRRQTVGPIGISISPSRGAEAYRFSGPGARRRCRLITILYNSQARLSDIPTMRTALAGAYRKLRGNSGRRHSGICRLAEDNIHDYQKEDGRKFTAERRISENLGRTAIYS